MKELEEQLILAEDTEYIETALALSQAYLRANEFYKAIQRALEAYEKAAVLNDKYYMALALNYEGNAILQKEKSLGSKGESADEIAKKYAASLRLLKGTDHKDLKLDNLRSLQEVAQRIGDNKLARQYREQVERLSKGMTDDPQPIGENGLGDRRASSKSTRGNIFNRNKKQTEALNEKVEDLSEERQRLEAEKELLSTERELMEQQMISQRIAIAELNQEQLGNELLITHQRILMDSLMFARQLDSFKLERQQNELRAKESALRLERYQRRFIFALGGIVLLIAFGTFLRFNSMKRHNKQLALKNQRIKEEQNRSDGLLRNILPASIAEELKTKGSAQPKQHQQVTVMFTDFKSFSTIAEKLTPDELVNELHHCFKAFDEIIERYGLEKIKTIGDAYMCAGGLPIADPGHPVKVVAAAMDIQRFLKDWSAERATRGLLSFEARIGIHTGPVVAGIVGIRKFAYDMWGDTVNIASRMESYSEPGKINISGSTYELVKDHFHCIHRGKLPERKGSDVEMYFVEYAIRSEAVEKALPSNS